jgi:hypothetical protein
VKKSDEYYLYQWASLIVDEVEKEAISSETREGSWLAMRSPLATMSQILQSQENILRGIGPTMPTPAAPQFFNEMGPEFPESPGIDSQNEGTEDNSPACDDNFDLFDVETLMQNTTTPQVVIAQGERVDPLRELFSKLNEDFANWDIDPEKTRDWFDECLGCELSIQFNWQLKPMSLLGPIGDLLQDIENIVNQVLDAINPFGMLEDLCLMLDAFKFFCPPDLIMFMISLQMLLKKYIMFTLDIKLDWTSIVGPLLKLIVDAMTMLLEQIIAIIVQPLVCIINALEMASGLFEEGINVAKTAVAAGQALGDTFAGANPGAGQAPSSIPFLAGEANGVGGGEIGWDGGSAFAIPSFGDAIGGLPELPGITSNIGEVGGQGGFSLFGSGTAEAQQSEGAPSGVGDYGVTGPLGQKLAALQQGLSGGGSKSVSFGIPVGVGLKAKDTLAKRMKEQNWKYVNPIDKAIVAVKEVKTWIQELFGNILFALKSLDAFMGGSLGLQIGGLGAINTILDLISLVMLIIKMKSNMGTGDLADWCRELEENPDRVKEWLKIVYPNATVSLNEDQQVTIEQGSASMTIAPPEDPSCTTDAQEETLRLQWAEDLARSME